MWTRMRQTLTIHPEPEEVRGNAVVAALAAAARSAQSREATPRWRVDLHPRWRVAGGTPTTTTRKGKGRTNIHTYLTILSPPSQTALPINHQRVHCKALPFVFLQHPVEIGTACSCEGIGVGDAAQWYGNVAALVFARPPHAAAWVFSGTEAPG